MSFGWPVDLCDGCMSSAKSAAARLSKGNTYRYMVANIPSIFLRNTCVQMRKITLKSTTPPNIKYNYFCDYCNYLSFNNKYFVLQPTDIPWIADPFRITTFMIRPTTVIPITLVDRTRPYAHVDVFGAVRTKSARLTIDGESHPCPLYSSRNYLWN